MEGLVARVSGWFGVDRMRAERVPVLQAALRCTTNASCRSRGLHAEPGARLAADSWRIHPGVATGLEEVAWLISRVARFGGFARLQAERSLAVASAARQNR